MTNKTIELISKIRQIDKQLDEYINKHKETVENAKVKLIDLNEELENQQDSLKKALDNQNEEEYAEFSDKIEKTKNLIDMYTKISENNIAINDEQSEDLKRMLSVIKPQLIKEFDEYCKNTFSNVYTKYLEFEDNIDECDNVSKKISKWSDSKTFINSYGSSYQKSIFSKKVWHMFDVINSDELYPSKKEAIRIYENNKKK